MAEQMTSQEMLLKEVYKKVKKIPKAKGLRFFKKAANRVKIK